MLVAAGSWRLLLGPLRIRTPFRYHEKLVSGIMVKVSSAAAALTAPWRS